MSEGNNCPTPDILDQATRALRDAPVLAGPPAELAAAAIAAVQNRVAGAVPSEQIHRERRRRVMRYVGFGTTAAVVLGAAAFLWFGGNRAVALDKVLDKVKQAESVTFVEKQKLGEQAELTMEYSIRGPLVRIDSAGTVFVLDTKEKTGLMLITGAKAFVKIDKDSPSKIHGPAGKSPIDDLLALKDRKPESTVEEKLDGKVVHKLTIMGDPKADPPGDWVIWVDPKTELPVKMTYSGTTFAGDKQVPVTKTFEKFAWNAKLEDQLFAMKVPVGYTEGLPGQAPPPPDVLFVRAIDRVAKAASMRAVITLDSGEGQKIQMKVFQQGELMRGEAAEPGLVMILNGKEKKGLLLFTRMKTAQRLDLDKDDMARKMAKDVIGSTKMLVQLKEEKVAALPDETLEGRKLKVYELKGVEVKELPGATDITVWIDPKLLLPVHTRLQHRQKDKTVTITLDVLGWNEELDVKIFELTVPPGYKLTEPPEKK